MRVISPFVRHAFTANGWDALSVMARQIAPESASNDIGVKLLKGLLQGAPAGRCTLALFPSVTRCFACRAGLDRAPPKTLVIEYDPEDVDTYIKIADELEAVFPNVVVEGNLRKDGRPGSFEILTTEGQQIFSRLQNNIQPQVQDIIRRVAPLVPAYNDSPDHVRDCQ